MKQKLVYYNILCRYPGPVLIHMLNLDLVSSHIFVMREGSFLDPYPDPHGSALILVGNVDPDPDPGGLK
jgi:hypothetical protein